MEEERMSGGAKASKAPVYGGIRRHRRAGRRKRLPHPSIAGDGDSAEGRDKLDRERVSLGALELRSLLDLVADFHKLITVGAKAGHQLIGLVAGEGIGADVADARGYVPTRGQQAPDFGVS